MRSTGVIALHLESPTAQYCSVTLLNTSTETGNNGKSHKPRIPARTKYTLLPGTQHIEGRWLKLSWDQFECLYDCISLFRLPYRDTDVIFQFCLFIVAYHHTLFCKIRLHRNTLVSYTKKLQNNSLNNVNRRKLTQILQNELNTSFLKASDKVLYPTALSTLSCLALLLPVTEQRMKLAWLG